MVERWSKNVLDRQRASVEWTEARTKMVMTPWRKLLRRGGKANTAAENVSRTALTERRHGTGMRGERPTCNVATDHTIAADRVFGANLSRLHRTQEKHEEIKLTQAVQSNASKGVKGIQEEPGRQQENRRKRVAGTVAHQSTLSAFHLS